MLTLSDLILLLFIHVPVGVLAAKNEPFQCRFARNFYHVNGSSSISFPAPKLVGGDIQQDTAEQWTLTRTASFDPSSFREKPTSWVNFFLDTANTNTTGIKYCAHRISPEGIKQNVPSGEPKEGYTFSSEALARSVNDTGDCKIMLGQKCVDALREQSKRSTTGRSCPTLGLESIPQECTSISVWNQRWDNLGFSGRENTTNFSTPDNTDFGECDPPVQPLSKSVQALSMTSMGSINAIRAPAIVILSISRDQPESSSQVIDRNRRIEIFCPRADEIITPGSPVPPKMDEIMKWPNTSFVNTTYKAKTSPASRAVAHGYGLWSVMAMIMISALCL